MVKYSLSFVVPTFNEKQSVDILYKEIEDIIKRIGSPSFEVVFVDDGSTDQTPMVLDRLFKKYPNHVVIVTLRANFGKSEALMRGFEACRNEIIVTLDADLQDDPSCLPKFLERIEEGYDFVCGWKKVRHDSIGKRLPSKVFNWGTAKLSRIPLQDFNCGFKVFRREFTKDLVFYGDQYRFLPVFAKHMGFKITEVEVNHRPRKFGVSKFGALRLFTGSFDLITLLFLTRFSFAPLHFFGLFGVFLIILGTGVISTFELRKLLFNIPIGPGRPIIIVSATVAILGTLLIVFGIISELIISLTAKISNNNRAVNIKSLRDERDPGNHRKD
jgi:glycosyltransferase involved in cell wall biosynthesis|tara:strand:- start:700 stop:1686 length:987 start_codon:yes stop_codon:yes gene_type:complete